MIDDKTADELKVLGNEAFATKDYDGAIQHYSNAIKINGNNHVFYSNRSASYAGKEEWEAAVSDAKACIRFDPTFVKGYYRLATAQIGMNDWDAAIATVKHGLSIDADNVQLQNQLRTIKQNKKAASNAAAKAAKGVRDADTMPPTNRGMDASVSAELTELQQQYVQTNREFNTVKANIAHTQREYKLNELSKEELSKVLETESPRMYGGVGKMFLLSSRDEVLGKLNKTMKDEKKRELDLTQKLDYLERRMKSQRQNMEDLMRAP